MKLKWKWSSHKQKAKQQGVSLVEMVIFIVLVGIIATGLMLALQSSIKSLPESADDVVAMNLAQSRLDFILGQKKINGFASFTDLCASSTPPAICATPAGYTITSTITRGADGDDALGTIQILVTGKGRAELQTLFGDHV